MCIHSQSSILSDNIKSYLANSPTKVFKNFPAFAQSALLPENRRASPFLPKWFFFLASVVHLSQRPSIRGESDIRPQLDLLYPQLGMSTDRFIVS